MSSGGLRDTVPVFIELSGITSTLFRLSRFTESSLRTLSRLGVPGCSNSVAEGDIFLFDDEELVGSELMLPLLLVISYFLFDLIF